MTDGRPIYFHTNVPAPYRKHQFELLAAAFPRAVFCLASNSQASYRPWKAGTAGWKCDCRVVTSVWKFWHLVLQKWGTVHVIAYPGSSLMAKCYAISGWLGHSIVLEWNDAGFPEKVDSSARKKWKLRTRISAWLRHKGSKGIYTAGDLGCRWALARGYKPGQIVNTYFSHDMDKFVAYRKAHYAESRTRIRKEIGIADDEILSLNISRYLDWKRLCDLAQAFQELESKDPDLAKKSHVVVVGEGECKDHIPILQQLKFVRVHLIEQMPPDEVMAYYCAADLFVFPSEGDIWGLVVNEALSMGVPVICTNRIGAAEVVHEGENGYRVPVRSPQDIADRVAELTSDRDKLARFSSKAKEIEMTWRTEMGVAALQKWLNENA